MLGIGRLVHPNRMGREGVERLLYLVTLLFASGGERPDGVKGQLGPWTSISSLYALTQAPS